MPSKPLAPVSSETREHLLKLIQWSEQPQTAKQLVPQLVGPFRANEKQLIPVLEEFVTAGRLRTFSLPRKQTRYWDRDIVEFGRVQIVRMLDAKGPLLKTELKKAINGLSEKQFNQALDGLIASSQVRKHPPLLPKARSPRYGRKPPSPEPYLKDVGTKLTKIVSQLKAAGVPTAALVTAACALLEQIGLPPAQNHGVPDRVEPIGNGVVDVIALMQTLEPRAESGALVTTHDLRRAARVDKRSFDLAVLDLARQGRITLYRHNSVMNLSQAERDGLVTDGADNFYIGVAMRRAAAS